MGIMTYGFHVLYTAVERPDFPDQRAGGRGHGRAAVTGSAFDSGHPIARGLDVNAVRNTTDLDPSLFGTECSRINSGAPCSQQQAVSQWWLTIIPP